MVHFSWKVGDWFPKWKGGGALLPVKACSSFWIAKLSETQESFDHPKDDYVRYSWEDVF